MAEALETAKTLLRKHGYRENQYHERAIAFHVSHRGEEAVIKGFELQEQLNPVKQRGEAEIKHILKFIESAAEHPQHVDAAAGIVERMRLPRHSEVFANVVQALALTRGDVQAVERMIPHHPEWSETTGEKYKRPTKRSQKRP
ncbi:MAG: hypothetical protein JW834_02080 [Candidatus Diapherotrites archaeon]|nr:hypothetical protein [Candidatus Diapherotrites archaeon]